MIYKTAEIIVVGSEFFTRTKSDTNSIWLTEQLEKRGVRVLAKRTVCDHLETLTRAYSEALASADLVISTGGLGPTADDRTRDAFAAATGVELAHQQSVEDRIAERFRRRGREMAENNRRQALIPVGAEVIPNAQGTAPGFHRTTERGTVLALPGPPREMSALFEIFQSQTEHKFPQDETVTVGQILRVTGLGESDMDRRISDLYQDCHNPEVTVNFNADGLEIHLTARAESEAAGQALIEPMVEQMRERLDGFLFSCNGSSLEEVVVKLLQQHQLRLALAESVTGGLVAHKIASVPGASQVLAGSLVTYTEQAKMDWLNVSQETLQQHTAVSEEVAQEMVLGAREKAGSDITLSCTGYAGPGGGTEQAPVGTAYIGFVTPERTSVRRVSLPGGRNLVRARIAQAMLFLLFRYLRKRPLDLLQGVS